jgi:hypothetical protein
MLPLLLFAGAMGALLLLSSSARPSVGDTATVGSHTFRLTNLGAGIGWKPVDPKLTFPDGTLAAFPEGTHRWFSGLGAFVKV